MDADTAAITLAPPPFPPPTGPATRSRASARVTTTQAAAPPPQPSARRATRHQRGNTRLDVLNRFYLEDPFLPVSGAPAGGQQQVPRHWFLRNRWDAKKAKTGMMDIAIDAIFQLGGGTSDIQRKNDPNSNFVLGIGSGQFRGRQQYSLHGPFLRRLVSKVRALPPLSVTHTPLAQTRSPTHFRPHTDTCAHTPSLTHMHTHTHSHARTFTHSIALTLTFTPTTALTHAHIHSPLVLPHTSSSSLSPLSYLGSVASLSASTPSM